MTIRNVEFRKTRGALFVASLILLLLAANPYPVSAIPTFEATTEITAPIDDFQLVDVGQGWALIGNQLFWSSDFGLTWNDITPDDPETILGVNFIDTQLGFLLSHALNLDNTVQLTLMVTEDGGTSWLSTSAASYSMYDPAAAIEKVHLFFLDRMSGWIVLKQSTSSNFNLGSILRTTDGGASWDSNPGPSGEDIFFINQSIGFMTGGPRRDTLFRTTDGGSTWHPVSSGLEQPDLIFLPNFLMPSLGHTAAISSSNAGTDFIVLETNDLGSSWTEHTRVHLTDEAEIYPIVANLPGAIKAFSSGQIVTYWQTIGEADASGWQNSENISRVMLSGSGNGWAIANQLVCPDANDSSSCSAEQMLIQTWDGGNTWRTVSTPSVMVTVPASVDTLKMAREADFYGDRTTVWSGQGFDMCDIATAKKLKSWKLYSPLSAVNLYFGGPVQACDNENLTPAFLEELSMQGWKFIPTWVGPQAACSPYSKTMSWDPDTAEGQGKGQAVDAARNAWKFGLGREEQDGRTVIYYDLEAFDTLNGQCLAAAKAFIDGWVWQLHEFNITAGVYGSVCASGLEHFYTIANPPDVIWPANWVSNYYNSGVSPETLPCISDTQWSNHQRILQYTGPHEETWGGVPLGIDLNVIDGVVADITDFVGAPPTALENGSFESGLLAPWQIDPEEFACDQSLLNNSDEAHSGNHYLAINKGPGDTNCEGVSQPLPHIQPLVSGDQYRFAVWARSSQSGVLRSTHLKLTANGPTPVETSQSFSGIGDDWVCLEIAHTINQNDHTGITPAVIVDDADGIDLLLDDAQVSLNTGKLCPTIPSPSNLNASDASDDGRVFVRWDPVPGASYYKVYRWTDHEPGDVLLDRVLTNQFIDTDANHFVRSYYNVKACNAGGCSDSSNQDGGILAWPYYDFFDGFEDNNINRWDSSVNHPEFINTCSTGNLNGNYGLCVNTTLESSAYLLHNLDNAVNMLEIKFKFDPNNVNLNGHVFNLAKMIDTNNSKQALTVQISNAPAGYWIRISAQLDDGSRVSSDWVPLADSRAEIMLSWWSTIGQLRSAPTFSGASLRINGQEAAELTGLKNHQIFVDRVVVGGIVFAPPIGAAGTYFIDDISISGPLFVRPIIP